MLTGLVPSWICTNLFYELDGTGSAALCLVAARTFVVRALQ